MRHGDWSNQRVLVAGAGCIPAGRVATIDDVAGAMVYLASPAAGKVTGAVLPGDGGWTAQ